MQSARPLNLALGTKMDNKTIEGPWEETDFRLIIGRTKIDYDWTKEEANRKKHGYSLESAVHFLEQTLLFSPSPPMATSDPIEVDREIRYQTCFYLLGHNPM